MAHPVDETDQRERTDYSTPPPVIVLGDAAVLTRGSDDTSVEGKQEPYD